MPAADVHRRMSFADVPETSHTSYLEALMHVIKGNVGVGLFAMGFAFKHGGMMVAPVVTIALAVICIHCQHLLLHCTHLVNIEVHDGKSRIEYSEAVELCFAQGRGCFQAIAAHMGVVCNVFIAVTQLGFCVIYLTFIATNLEQIFDFYGIDMNIRVIMLIAWIPAWLTCLITNLKALAPVSITANICVLSSFIFCMYFALANGLPDIKERKQFTNYYDLMIFISAVIFSYEGIALVLPVMNSMKKPKNFARAFGVLNVGMTIVVTMYMLSGVCGYMKWGEDVGGTLTVNIGNSIFATFTKVLVSLGILFTYPLQFYVPISAMVPYLLDKCNCHHWPLLCELLFRTLVSMGTLLVAEAFPNVAIFISLIGALCSTVLALVFPPMMECILLQDLIENPVWLKTLKLIKNILILIFAFCAFVLGTFVSVKEIVRFFVAEWTQ